MMIRSLDECLTQADETPKVCRVDRLVHELADHARRLNTYASAIRQHAVDLAVERDELRKPIDMILHCPKCHAQHIDAPTPAEYIDVHMIGDIDPVRITSTPEWTNPPHRSHLCATCGHIWRPADVYTNGVAKIKTKGANDS